MKRPHSPVSDIEGKRKKSGLDFLGRSLSAVKALCSSDAWHAAKQLLAEGAVDVVSYVLEQHGCVVVQGQITAVNVNAAAFPHLRPALVASQTVPVQLCLNPSTGLLLDAATSCCPGGFQPVLGSFCPCAAALLLHVAKQAQSPEEGRIQPLEGLPAWEGSSLFDALGSQGQLPTATGSGNSGGSSINSQQQHTSRLSDMLVPHPSCYTGLGLEPWHYESCVTATAAVHLASQRNQGVYGYTAPRPNSDPDKLPTIEDVNEDLSSNAWFQNVSHTSLQLQRDFPNLGSNDGSSDIPAGGAAATPEASLPSNIHRALTAAGIPVPGAGAGGGGGGAEGAAGARRTPGVSGGGDGGAADRSSEVARRLLLFKATKQWLSVYGGELVGGWENRPKVINMAFDLLTGNASGSPGRPLSALVLLLRAMWEYLHHHGLARMLAKPLKLLHAIRSVLLVGSVPLWARRAVAAQVEVWEKGLLWQNATTPLDISGGSVGLVHVLRALQEVKELCWHHWDEPHLAKLLAAGFAEQHAAAGGSSSAASHPSGPAGDTVSNSSSSRDNRAAAWATELPSLLQLRLQALDALGASYAYLELAMAGGAWREAINRLLDSKERSQLLKAVSLLTRHITSLPERLAYMSQIVQLDSLGAPERLEVTARLLLDLREQLHPTSQPVRVLPRTRYGTSPLYSGHLWHATVYSLHLQPSEDNGNNNNPRGVANHAANLRDNQELMTAWSKFLKLFVRTAAEALFAAGRTSAKAHKEHLRDEGLEDPPAEAAEGTAGEQGQQQDGQAGAAAGAEGSRPAAHPPQTHARVASVSRYFCPACNRVHDHEEPIVEEPPIVGPQPGDPDWQLLDVDQVLLDGANGPSSSVALPVEATNGSLKGRSTTGYLDQQNVVDAFKKAVPVAYPSLLALCSLDALCLSTLSTQLMEHFDAGGKLDTSLGIEPLRELLGHPLVELGPGPVRVQAALEAVVYTSAMTPLQLSVEVQLENFYRDLAWHLLGSGQRSLALLVCRARFKLCPSARSAGELMEVAISAGPEAQVAAVDLILCKGCVRAPGPEDEPIVRDLEGRPPSAAGGGADAAAGAGIRDAGAAAFAAEMHLLRREMQLLSGMMPGMGMEFFPMGEYSDDSEEYWSEEDMDDDVYEHRLLARDMERFYVQRNGGLVAGADGVRPALGAARDDEPIVVADSGDDEGDRGSGDGGSSDEDDEDGSGSDKSPPGVVMDAGGEAGSSRAAAAGAAAGGAAGPSGPHDAHDRSDGDLPSRGRGRVRAGAGSSRAATGPSAAAAEGDAAMADAEAAHEASDGNEGEDDGLGSLDTRQLLGSDAAAAIQLKDTASSRAPAVASAAAGGGGGGGGGRDRAPSPDRGPLQLEDDMDMEYYYPRPPRPMRNLPPAQPAQRPSRRPSGAQRRAAARQAAAAAAAAGGSNGGGGGGGGSGGSGDDDEPGGQGRGHQKSHRKHHKQGSRGRRSSSFGDPNGDPQQAALVSELFGITSSSHHHPWRTLRVHIRRLSGLQLWAVTKYVAGRGADKHQLQRLGMAAWLSDGNTSGISSSNQTLRLSDALRWTPVASNQQTWLEAAQRVTQMVHTHLPAPPYEPYQGNPITSRSWSGLPCSSWDSFIAQERYPSGYPGSQQHHDTPDANLAWLLAVLREPEESPQQPQQQQQPQQESQPAWLQPHAAAQQQQPPDAAGPSSSGGGGTAAADQATQLSASTGGAATPAAAAAVAAAASGPPGTLLDLSSSLVLASTQLDDMLARSTKLMMDQLLAATSPMMTTVVPFIGINHWAGPVSGYVFKLGPQGLGYYKDARASLAAAAAAAAAVAGPPAASTNGLQAGSSSGLLGAAGASAEQKSGADLAGCSELLQQLASLSQGTRFGLPVLQLCHALMTAGCRDACLSLLPQALMPEGATMLGLQPNTCLVAGLQELLPTVAKHGDVALRVAAAVSAMLIMRRPLHCMLLSETEVLSGVFSWWLGLVSTLHHKPEDWSAVETLSDLNHHFGSVAPVSGGGNNWAQLQRMLIRCVLRSLGGGDAANGQLTMISGEAAGARMQAAEGFELLLGCDAVKRAHWAFRLFLARTCHLMRLCTNWSCLGRLLCPALRDAVDAHIRGWSPEDRQPPADMKEWKAKKAARALPAASTRARNWVAETLDWVATELAAERDKAAASGGQPKLDMLAEQLPATAEAASAAQKEDQREDFVQLLCATLSGWHGPELVVLSVAVRPQKLSAGSNASNTISIGSPGKAGASSQEQQQQQQFGSLLSLLEAGLLPRVGRADELAESTCVKRGQYKCSLRLLMKDGSLLATLPKDLVRSLALTYWQQEATPEALLTANELLLRLEGAQAAQALALPQAAGTGGGPSDPAGTSSAALFGLSSLVAGLRAAGNAGADAAHLMGPQVHAVLLEQLDLVPSRGGIEAAGLRFLQLQRHAAKGHHNAAIESIFSSEPSSSGNSTDLTAQMEVADAVLRLAADTSDSNECIRAMMHCAAYNAIATLENPEHCSDGGMGPAVLAPLTTQMKQHVLRLCIWRLVRSILQRPPPLELRKSLGPEFVQPRAGGNAAYTAGNPPEAPSYLSGVVRGKWASRVPFNSLYSYCIELGLVQGSMASHSAQDLSDLLLRHLEQQEHALVWAIKSLAALVTGPQLEASLVGLMTSPERIRMANLPVFMTGLGELLKANRSLMWAYTSLRRIPVVDKIQRYIRRSVHDVATLQRYLVKCTIAEIQCHKCTSLPWANWDMGSKAAQAQELSEWLYWCMITWPNTRVAVGVSREPPAFV